MKPILIDRKSAVEDIVQIKEVNVSCLKSPLHFHNAYEIVLILKSQGHRIVGDNIDNFTDGDLVMLGPGLPHVWYNEKDYYLKGSRRKVQAIVIYFPADLISREFLKFPSMSKIKKLLQDMNRGIQVTGETRLKLANLLLPLNKANGLQRVVQLLNALDLLSNSRKFRYLASEGYVNSYSDKDVKRIDKVYQYVMENYAEKIKLREIAGIAHITPTAFCRYFKTRTQKTFTSFVNEVRIGFATKLLYNEDISVSEICYKCGFNNRTNFSRIFKKLNKVSPTAFRANLKRQEMINR